MIIRRTKVGTCPTCGKSLFLITDPVVASAAHHCTPILSAAQQIRAAHDLAIESGRLSSYRYGARSYLRSL